MVASFGGAMHYSEPRFKLVVDIPSQITPKQITSMLLIYKSLLKFIL